MSVISFTLLPLLAAANTASNVVTKVNDSNFLVQFLLDEGTWDAVMEAAIVLAVFGITLAVMSSRTKPTSKNLRQKKAKAVPASATSQNPRRFDTEGTENKYNSNGSGALAGKSRAGLGARMTPMSATDAIANAVRAGKAASLPQLLDASLTRALADAKVQGESMSEEEVATTLLHSAIRTCAAARCFREAIAAYDHMADRIGDGSFGVWSVLLYVIVEARDFQRCNLVFANLSKQGKPSGHDFVNMVRCFAAREDSQGLREMLVHLQSSSESVDTYTWNRALAACSNSERALDLAEELRSANICQEGLDNVSYNTLMKYSAKAGQLSRCFELYSEMLEKGLEASEVTFGVLLDACVGAQNLDQGRKVFGDLCASGLPLNVVHCTTYIKGLVGAGKLDEASDVVQEMTRSIGVKPDIVTYSTIVKGYSDIGDVTAALKMVEQMVEEGVRPDEIICNSVLSGCSVFPLKSSCVLSTFEALVKHGLRPTTTTLSIMLKGLAHSEAWDASLKLLSEANQNFRLQPELRLYSQLGQACAKTRAFGTVLDVFDAMLITANRRKEKVDPIIAGRFLRSCLLGGSVEAATKLQQAARQAGVSIDPQVEKMLQTALSKRPRSY